MHPTSSQGEMAVLAKKEHSLAKSMHSTGTHWDWDVSFLRSMEYGIYSVLFVGQTCRTPIKNSYFEDISGYPPRILFFWWFGVYNQIWLVVSNIFYFHNIWHVILPIDHCIFNMVKNRRPVLDNGVLMVYNNVHLSICIYIYIDGIHHV